MEDTLALERMVNRELLALHRESDTFNDPHVSACADGSLLFWKYTYNTIFLFNFFIFLKPYIYIQTVFFHRIVSFSSWNLFKGLSL